MFWEILLAIFLGVNAGTLTGLIPGVHINLISLLLITFSPILLNHTSPLTLATFIIAMSITHTFLDVIPSTFLGAPDADMVMSVLPAHRLLLEGKGFEAVKLATIGSLLSLIIGTLFIPILILTVPIIYSFIRSSIGWILLSVIAFMILKEHGKKKLLSLFIFLLSGALGIVTLTFPNLSQPLFPLLSGLFGVSGLLISLFDKVSIPKQTISETIHINTFTKLKSVFAAVFSGWLTSMLPGLGSAQAAIIASVFVRHVGEYTYLVLVGGINTVNFLLSLVTFFTLEKARNGAVIAVREIIGSLNTHSLLIFLATALIVGGTATFLAMYITRVFAFGMQYVNYKALCISVIIFIILLTMFLSGPIGLLVLLTSTALGILPVKLGVGRNHAMGCLLLPVIGFFLL